MIQDPRKPLETEKKAMRISLSPYSTYMQSFNIRSTVLPEISLDEKSVTYTHQGTHPPTQLVKVDTTELQ